MSCRMAEHMLSRRGDSRDLMICRAWSDAAIIVTKVSQIFARSLEVMPSEGMSCSLGIGSGGLSSSCQAPSSGS